MGGIGKCIKILLGISVFSLASMKGLSFLSEHSADLMARYEKSAGVEAAKEDDDTIAVTDHKSFLDAVYSMALDRKLLGSFYYKGDYSDIFDGDINALLNEVCSIDDKKTSDDADYLENSISTINVGTSYNYIGSKIIDSTITIKIKYLESAAQLKEVNKKIEKILKELGIKGKSDYQKVKLIHDYIVNNTKYASSSEDAHTAYGALQGKAVCQGYSQLAYKMLTDAGIKCYFISGKANNGKRTEDHAWNLVRVKKKWYYLDVTWDDPTGGEDRLRYDYFLAGSKRFEKDHMAAKEFKKLIAKANKSDYKK